MIRGVRDPRFDCTALFFCNNLFRVVKAHGDARYLRLKIVKTYISKEDIGYIIGMVYLFVVGI
jgi:hypothetical protein